MTPDRGGGGKENVSKMRKWRGGAFVFFPLLEFITNLTLNLAVINRTLIKCLLCEINQVTSSFVKRKLPPFSFFNFFFWGVGGSNFKENYFFFGTGEH